MTGRMISRRRSTILIAIAVSIVVVAAVFVASRPPIAPASDGTTPPPATPNPKPSACPRSVGLCIARNVTRTTDADTLAVAATLPIRLVLVNAPELHGPTAAPAERRWRRRWDRLAGVASPGGRSLLLRVALDRGLPGVAWEDFDCLGADPLD